MLYIFSGLPGTGKSTLARALARHLGAVHLRIDRIEQALRVAELPHPDTRDDAGDAGNIGDAGYRVAFALAEDHLQQGLTVIADAVNALAATRQAWRALAQRAGVAALDIELHCSDPAQHRRQVGERVADIEGLHQPSWAQVQARHFEPLGSAPRIVIDSAGQTAAQSFRSLLDALALRRQGCGRRD